MTRLEALSRRGYHVWLTPEGHLRINPSPNQGIREKIVANRQAVIDELILHQETLHLQVLDLEERILKSYSRGTANEYDTRRRLQYIYRLTAAAPSAYQPCEKCGETLLWRYRQEVETGSKLPELCYTCHPCPDIWQAEFYLSQPKAAGKAA